MVQNSDDLLHANICSIHMAAFENHPDALFVLDSDGYYRQYNKKIFSVLGYSEQDYVTARFGDFTPGLDGDLGRQRVQKAACGESQQFVLNTRHRDGSEAYLQTTLVPVTIDGHVWIMGYSKDITKQVKVEQELRENQELLSRALEIAKLGNWSLDFETRRLELTESAQVIFGVPYCILPSSKVAEKIHPNDYDMVLQITLRSINEPGLISDCDFRVIQQDGTVRYVHTQWTVTTDNTVKRPVLFGTVQDITERKQTEEMLVNSEKLAVVGQLAAGMAHEIRNPLMVAQGFIQLLETTPVDIAKKSSYFELVKESHKQIDLLAEQMLVLAKPQAENRTVKNIVSVVQDIVNVFRAESLLHNVEINYEHESEYIPVTCNEQRIKQVFINIMKNAFEAEAKECKVSVNLVPDASAVSVTFNDNGQGIDPTRVKSIGEPFYTTKEKGTGLGLMVSKKIIQDHAGMLVLSSEAGVGTTVTITLPIVTPQTPCE